MKTPTAPLASLAGPYMRSEDIEEIREAARASGEAWKAATSAEAAFGETKRRVLRRVLDRVPAPLVDLMRPHPEGSL